MLLPLKFQPGIVRDTTDYSNTGGWYDCNWVRFRMGMPEKMGGWQQQISTQFLGICRSMISWSNLTGLQYLGLGTNLKYYVSDFSLYMDVTPIRAETMLGANPFSVTNGSTTMTVTDVANGAVLNDFVTFSGATGGFAGLSAGDLNREFQITGIITDDSYTVELAVVSNNTTTGGGAAVEAAYQINVGLDTNVQGVGWGAGTWGHDTWGSNAANGVTLNLRLWSDDNFGEDLIAGIYNGGIYYWDATFPQNRMVALEDLAGASNAPVIATQIMVSAEEQHVIAFGTNPLGSGVQDPMFVRWSDSQSPTMWTPQITNTAGGYRLSVGSKILGTVRTRSEILIYTDVALYSMRFVGGSDIFGFFLLGDYVSLIGPNAVVSANDTSVWMGKEQFFIYDGRISVLPCPITDYVFRRLNYAQLNKIFAFTNALFDEIGWLYPSTTDECDSYVIYNYKEKAWYYGTLLRTAWLDRGPNYYPLATSSDRYLYNHEFGLDDGSVNPPIGIDAFIESSPLEASMEGAGDRFLFLDRMIPDITFRNSTSPTPTVTMTLQMQNYPGSGLSQTFDSAVVSQAAVDVTEFTGQAFIRLRGRSAKFRCESTATGVTWRLGTPRVSYRLDGRR